MPRILINTIDEAICYVIDAAVGRGAQNDRPDVLLVQYFLSVLTSSAGARVLSPRQARVLNGPTPALAARTANNILGRPTTPNLSTPPGGTPIVVDGFCGPQTIAYIEYFQQLVNQAESRSILAVTGRVLPVGMGDYTLTVMNEFIDRIKSTVDLFTDIAFPRELRDYFFF